VLADIAPLRKHVIDWLVRQATDSAAFRQTLLPRIQEILRSQRTSRSSRSSRCRAEIAALDLKEQNLRKAIALTSEMTGDSLEALVKDVNDISSQLRRKKLDLEQIQDAPEDEVLTDEQILDQLEVVLIRLIDTSFEMAEVLRQLIDHCEIIPVQALDSGLVRARAKIVFRTMAFGPDESLVEGREEMIVDLFESPVHIAFLQDAVKLRGQTPRPTLKQIGAKLGTSYMTVKRALGYKKLMDDEGLSTPYRELTSKPVGASRWRHAS
jgi:hypothetical protein